MRHELLVETRSAHQANVMETRSNDGQDLFLNGIMMQSNVENGNERNYPLKEISAAVDKINEQIEEGFPVMGELNHPDHLQIDLERVSHAIVEARMDGNDAIGKMKILNTPMGNIARGLIEGGIRLGVSSRGTGIVKEGVVSDFDFLTVDIVATPSAPNAYPQAIREQLENIKNGSEIFSLAEAVNHDAAAQIYFAKEMKTFIESLKA